MQAQQAAGGDAGRQPGARQPGAECAAARQDDVVDADFKEVKDAK